MAALAYFSFPYVLRSFAAGEGSREASGLPALYLVKTLIPFFALLMTLQGLAQALRACDTLRKTGPR
jgi:TRAP-type mannitol/chloroaromatic compound transport system permease small subunit